MNIKVSRKFGISISIIIIILGLICGIMCAWECDLIKSYVENAKIMDSPSYSQNLKEFIIILFSTIFSFLISLFGSFVLLYILKNKIKNEEVK